MDVAVSSSSFQGGSDGGGGVTVSALDRNSVDVAVSFSSFQRGSGGGGVVSVSAFLDSTVCICNWMEYETKMMRENAVLAMVREAPRRNIKAFPI